MDHAFYEGYVEKLINDRSPLLTEMEAFARVHHVPIMDLTGSEVLLSLLAMQRPTRILEVGTAIGYSAIRMAELLPDAEIVTIERNARRFEEATEFINRSDVRDRITLVHGDAVESIGTIEGEFDAVFI
ncbi:MAG: class I SAM-dependent methyltransferase, partial [Exiguobacterium sp.]|nr:class I SAM-dependent methyltransferase [Exiguobacterium sp.]